MSDDTRRGFLQTSGCALVALAACALAAPDLGALPVTTIVGEARGEERRYPIPGADSVSVDHQAQAIVARYQGHVFAFSLGCPHEHAAVRWVDKDHRFQCSKHDSRYQQDGVHISGRATRNLDRFAIHRDGNVVVVDLDRHFESDRDPAGWAAATVAI
jgi:nitrite reductase/ring-hydroxylating ferredoxin subunit